MNPGDKTAETHFKEVQQAYDVLSDQEKRARYDQFGHAGIDGMAAAGARPGGPEWATHYGQPGYETIDLSDLFSNLRGGTHEEAPAGESSRTSSAGCAPAGPPASGPADAGWKPISRIPFLTAVRGGETTIQVDRGAGKSESLVVKIPPGIDTGAKLRLKGQGEPGTKGSPPGDLTITVQVETHPYFTREGRNLSVEVPITAAEAILGAKIDVPTLNAMKSLTIPPGSSSGQKLRLKGQGIPASAGKPEGDLYVILKVVVPKSVDATSRRLIQEFAERNPLNPRAGIW